MEGEDNKLLRVRCGQQHKVCSAAPEYVIFRVCEVPFRAEPQCRAVKNRLPRPRPTYRSYQEITAKVSLVYLNSAYLAYDLF